MGQAENLTSLPFSWTAMSLETTTSSTIDTAITTTINAIVSAIVSNTPTTTAAYVTDTTSTNTTATVDIVTINTATINTTILNTTTTVSTNISDVGWPSRCPCPCRLGSSKTSQSSAAGYCRGYVIPPEFFLPSPLSPGMLALLTSLYALVVVAALVGNTAVVVVVLWARMVRSFTDAFILSLAVSDLLVAGFNMPVRLLSEMWNEWPLGLAACRLTEYLQAVTIVNNILTLTAIAVDRYVAICREHSGSRWLSGRQRTVWGLVAVWTLSLVAVTPQLFVTGLDMRIKRDPHSLEIRGRAWVCAELVSHKERRVYTLAIYTCLYVLPMLVMSYAYGAIARRLWRRERRSSDEGGGPVPLSSSSSAGTAAPSSTSHSRSSSASGVPSPRRPPIPRSYPPLQTAMARRRRVTVMMLALVLAFTLLWLPFFSASLYSEFRGGHHARFRATRAFLQLVGYCTCCVNPVIYTFLNRRFQDRLCALCCRPGRTRVGPSEIREAHPPCPPRLPLSSRPQPSAPCPRPFPMGAVLPEQ